MSNVEYVCNVCGNRAFALPGGTKLKCPRTGGSFVKDGETVVHGESQYVQKEGWGGADFLFIDDEGKTASHDVVAGQEKLRVATPEQEAGADTPEDAELIAYRAMYESLTGNEVDKRWRVPTIKDQINQHMDRMAEAKAEELVESAGGGQSKAEADDGEAEPDDQPDDEPTEPENPGEVVEDIPDNSEEPIEPDAEPVIGKKQRDKGVIVS